MMFKNLLITAKINITSLGNKTIYNFRKTPILKYLFNDNSYTNPLLVLICAFLGGLGKGIKNIFISFIGYFIFFLIITILCTEMKVSIYTGYTFLLLIMALITSNIFKATDSKFNTVIMMRLNPKQYAIQEIFLTLIKNTILLFLPLASSLFVNSLEGEPFLIPLQSTLTFYIFAYLFVNLIMVLIYDKTKKILPESKLYVLVMFSLILIPALLIFTKVSIELWFFQILTVLLIAYVLIMIPWLIKTTAFNKLYKERFSSYNSVIDTENAYVKQFDNTVKMTLETDANIEKKKGYDYFNELFIARHKSILCDNATILMVGTVIVIGVLIVLSLIFEDLKTVLAAFLTTRIPYIVELMLFTNRGTQITQAMYFHCDNAMLQYNFYRNPKIILDIFTKRLISIIKINLKPTLAMIIGLDILSFICNGFNILNVLGITLSVFMINIFFSIHYLGLYYLLQPYTNNMKEKNHVYNFITAGTFIVLYYFVAELVIDTFIFSVITVVFTVIYFIAMCLLVRKYSYKTFKLK